MEKPKRQLVYSGIKCLQCNEILPSYHKRDFKQCGCSNEATIDGGLSDPRYSAIDILQTQIIDVYADEDEDFEYVRIWATRGGRGKDGKQPLTWIRLCDMTNAHLEAVIAFGGAAWHLELISKELQYRRTHNILIEEL